MPGHEVIELPHRHMTECAKDAKACIDGALDFEHEMEQFMIEDVLLGIAEDCDMAEGSCTELLQYVIDTPYGRGRQLSGP